MITNKVFDDARDKNVANFVVYGKAADSKLYYDSDYTTQVTQADVEDAFNKGRLIVMNSTTALVPIALSANKVLTASMAGSPAAITGTEWAAVATPAG